jgi:RimJ/RimL family protein N-acetyltransferase
MERVQADGQPRIVLDGLVLRPWRPGDEVSLVRHANNRRIWRNVRDRFPHPYTENDARLWIKIANRDPTMINVALEVEGQAVGGVGVMFKDDVYRRSAEIGYWLGEAYWNRGLTSRAVAAVSDYVFAHFDVVRLYAGVFAHNVASARVLEKAGYAFEARLRQSVFKDGQTLDELVYAKLRYPKGDALESEPTH